MFLAAIFNGASISLIVPLVDKILVEDQTQTQRKIFDISTAVKSRVNLSFAVIEFVSCIN